MCAHTPANAFSLNQVTHHALYCLILYCIIAKTILLRNRRIMTKIWKFNMDTIIHFSPYSNFSIIVPIMSYLAVLFLSGISPQRPSARGNWWQLRHLVWTPLLCWGFSLALFFKQCFSCFFFSCTYSLCLILQASSSNTSLLLSLTLIADWIAWKLT